MRLLPNDIDAEQRILSSFIYDFDDMSQFVRILMPSDFYKESHKLIFTAIYDLFEDGSPVNLLTLKDILEKNGNLDTVGGVTYVASLKNDIPISHDPKYHIGIITEKAKLRRLITTLNDGMQKCYDQNLSELTVDILKNKLDEINTGIIPDEIKISDIELWINRSCGEFTLRDIYFDMNIKSVDQKKRCVKILERLVKEGILEYSSKRRGQYRPKQTDLIEMDFNNASGAPSEIWLPLGVHQMVNIYPGNIIQINGEKNSGKTGYVLNIIKGNRKKFNIHYFNSEMGADELKIRLNLFDDMTMDMWNFKAYERNDNFGDVLFKGENDLNIIDFLECHEDFWKMGKFMKNIHDNLGRAIAVVCVQKNIGASAGLGGGRTEEKPRLILNIEHGTVTIKMAKNWKSLNNPNGKKINFKLVNGCDFITNGQWEE